MVLSDDSDEPIAIEAPPIRRPSRAARTRSTAPRPPQPEADDDDVVIVDELAALPKRRGRPRKQPVAPPSLQNDPDSDEVVFLHQTEVGRGLSERFSFASSSTNAQASGSRRTTRTNTSTSARNIAGGSRRTTSKTPSEPTPPLLLEQERTVPFPDWLGKPAVLLGLERCVVCKRELKKGQSGPARWKHISTCLPPVHRPPNRPPDLKSLLVDALEPSNDLTLLEHRTARAEDLVRSSSVPVTTRGRKTAKLNISTVKASHARDDWPDEVASRVRDLVGESSPGPPGSSSRSSSRSASPSCTRARSRTYSSTPPPQQARSHSVTPGLPSTQPIGTSSLAAEYHRPPRTRSPSPESDLLPQAPPAIGLSQAVREVFQRQERDLAARTDLALSQAKRRHAILEADIGDGDANDGDGGYNPPPSQVTASQHAVTKSPQPPPQRAAASSSSNQPSQPPRRRPVGTWAPLPSPPTPRTQAQSQSQPFRRGGCARTPGCISEAAGEDREARARAARRAAILAAMGA